nr:glycosyltransferase [bacterium]
MHAESEGIAISIIIPAFNSAAVIGDCLTALNRQDVSRNRYEIIVVDDGSQDATAEIAQSLADEVIRTDNRGPASARNTGARAARGDILLFTDADCIPEQPWVRRMTAPFESSDIHGVKGAYLTRQTRWVARFVQAEYESKYRFMSRFDTIDFIDTYSAAFRRRTFLELNGFDETFPGASVEDQEFSFRMSAEGYTMVFVADARVLHRHADTLAWYFRKKFNIGYWKVKVLRRHPGKTVSDTH